MMDDIVHRAAEQLVDAVSGHGGCGRIHERCSAFEVEPVNSLAGCSQDEVVLLAQCFERIVVSQRRDADGSGHGA
jgi:hypothetical protein